jgi:hypothetical protein
MLRDFLKSLRKYFYYFRVEQAIRELGCANVVSHPAASHTLPAPLYISLTSYPPRFSQLNRTLLGLMNQSVRPDGIFLWISHADKSRLPTETVKLCASSCVQLRFCEDLKSYKKIIPMLREFPDAFIVTADDDHYYDRNWLARFVEAFCGDLSVVLCQRAHRIVLGANGLPEAYLSWRWAIWYPLLSPLVFPTGVEGVMYPPGVFHRDVLRDDLFRQDCPNADDLWLYWMVRLNGGMAKKIGWFPRGFDWPGTQQCALYRQNLLSSGNDRQIKNLIERYGFPNVYNETRCN